MKILFVCRSNILRSKIAEAYFKKVNKNKDIKVSSAGLRTDGDPLYEKEKEVAQEFGLKLSSKQKKLDKKLLDSQDLVVLVADNVNPKRIVAKKVIVWKIKDPKETSDKIIIRKVFLDIIKKVDDLVLKLEELK